jgi:hypothetical protein
MTGAALTLYASSSVIALMYLRLVGADNLCHQAIFMNHASSAVAAKDAEVVKVGGAIRQRAEWRGLVQGAVRPVGVG